MGPLFWTTLLIKFLGRVAVVAQRPLVVRLSRGRSVGPYVRACVGRSVCLSSALWKNGRSDPDAVWHHRSDGSRDEAGSGVWGSVHGKGYFWGEFRRVIVINQWGLTAYVCDSATTRPSSQISLGKLVIIWDCLVCFNHIHGFMKILTFEVGL